MTLTERLAADNLTKIAVKLILCIIVVLPTYLVSSAYISTEQSKTQLAARQHYDNVLLTYMRGGLPAVNARCILDSKYVVEIAPCVKASTPVPGRQL